MIIEYYKQIITKEDLIEYNKYIDRPLPLDIKKVEILTNMYGIKKKTIIEFEIII